MLVTAKYILQSGYSTYRLDEGRECVHIQSNVYPRLVKCIPTAITVGIQVNVVAADGADPEFLHELGVPLAQIQVDKGVTGRD